MFVCLFVCLFFFLLICVFRKCMCCVQLCGNGSVEGTTTSILKHQKVLTQPYIFAENVTLLSRNIMKLIPLGSQPQSIKSPLSPCHYTGCSLQKS